MLARFSATFCMIKRDQIVLNSIHYRNTFSRCEDIYDIQNLLSKYLIWYSYVYVLPKWLFNNKLLLKTILLLFQRRFWYLSYRNLLKNGNPLKLNSGIRLNVPRCIKKEEKKRYFETSEIISFILLPTHQNKNCLLCRWVSGLFYEIRLYYLIHNYHLFNT